MNSLTEVLKLSEIITKISHTLVLFLQWTSVVQKVIDHNSYSDAFQSHHWSRDGPSAFNMNNF